MAIDSESESAARRAVEMAAELAQRVIERERRLPDRARLPRAVIEDLGLRLAARGRSLEEVSLALDGILAETPSAASPRFLNQLFGGRDPAATLAEMVVPLSNTSMYTYKVAGAQVLVELEVLERLLAAVPFEEGEGMFAPGGSLANLTAILLARNETMAEVRDRGFRGETAVVYTSTAAHYSIRKAAGILGLGRESVREVPTDGQGSMIASELERMIVRDRSSGLVPVVVNATAGTTILGAIDPLAALARITREHGVWLHVDGALGASLLLSRAYRHRLNGIAAADSVAWNAHKMMGVPLACSVLLLRRRGLLERHLGESAGYLFQADESLLNPGTRSLQCGRRNDALKLWAAWAYHGDDGYDRMLTRLVDLAERAAKIIKADPELELVSDPQTVTVCFRVNGVDSAALCNELDSRSQLKIGHGSIDGTSAIRLVCVNPDLDENRIVEILEQIKLAGCELRSSASDD